MKKITEIIQLKGMSVEELEDLAAEFSTALASAEKEAIRIQDSIERTSAATYMSELYLNDLREYIDDALFFMTELQLLTIYDSITKKLDDKKINYKKAESTELENSYDTSYENGYYDGFSDGRQEAENIKRNLRDLKDKLSDVILGIA